jgi:DNA-binding MarR family transcriptional regulator
MGTAISLRTVVWHLVRRYRRDQTLPAPQLAVLVLIDHSGPLTTSSLAKLAYVRPQSMAHTVGQLKTAGLIERRPDPTDGRKNLVSLTASGRVTLTTFRTTGDSWVAEALDTKFTAHERRELERGIILLDRLVSQ